MEQKKPFNPHDKFFKESFSRKEIVKSFIEEHLPSNVLKNLNLKTLEITKDTFIDKELSEHFSDILYRVTISGKRSYLYLLFEHKSYLDNWIKIQMLRNMVKIWEVFLKQHKKAERLPVIIPLVIYHGKKRWTISNSFVNLFEAIPETLCYIPDFKTEVFDISHIPDDQIKGEVLLRVYFLIQKYIFRPDLIEKLHEILDLLITLSNKTEAIEYLEVILRYLVSSVDGDKENEMKKVIKKAVKDGGDIMSTIAEKWLQEGIEKGIEKGIERGIEKGIEKKAIADAEKMIEKRMTNEDIRDITGLSVKRIMELRKKYNKR